MIMPALQSIDERIIPYMQDASAQSLTRTAEWFSKCINYIEDNPDSDLSSDKGMRYGLTDVFFQMMKKGGESGGSAIKLLYDCLVAAERAYNRPGDSKVIERLQKAYIIMMPRWLDNMLGKTEEVNTD